MKRRSTIILLCFAFSAAVLPLNATASETPEETIEAISLQLAATEGAKERARLYCYRARNHEQTGNREEAKNDYFRALNTSYEGWILNELGSFMYRHGEYEKAFNVSLKVLEDFPYLKKEAETLKNQAKKRWDEEYAKQNPPTIIIDSEPDPNRVTRHDLMRQPDQGSPAPASSPAAKTGNTGGGSGGSHIRGFGTNSAFRKNYIESRKNKGP